VGGQDPYWTTYSYDAVGNRKTETQHKTAAGPTVDTVRTYAEPASGKHNLPGVTQTGTNPHTEAYTYDAAGATETRTFKQGTTTTVAQNLVWDDEGHLKSVTSNGKTTSYTYDADGRRLTRTDSTGTTLYLPGGNELHVDKVGLATGTRYYGTGTQTVAMRTDGKLTFLLTDHHGTTTTQVSADATQGITRRKTGIFGTTRGAQAGPWAGDKGFVGGTKDTDTGLTHLGAREYDPAIGRFISVDPLMDLTDSQQLHGYTYANNNPVSLFDPDGLRPITLCEMGCSNGDDTYRDWLTPNGDGTWTHHYENTHYVHDGGGNLHSVVKTGSDLPRLGKRIVHKAYDLAAQKQTFQILAALFLPDPTSWKDCFSGSGATSCVVAATDLPYIKALKLVPDSVIQKGPKAVEDWLTKEKREAPDGPVKCDECFLAGTDVLMADGETKGIEDVQVGDEVLATDPRTGESGPRKVTRLIVTDNDKHFNELSIATEDGIEQLTATHEHPFWSPSQNDWLPAEKLKPGMTLRTDEGDTVIVTGNRAFTTQARTYNLTVDDLHTYYVLAGATPVLVHNSNGCPTGRLSDPLPRGMNNKIASAYDDVKAGRIPSHDTYSGREHPWEKALPNGVKVYGWTSTHYTKIQRFSAPHFPDSGWN
jgi:RHS repeat-associated protein